MNDDYRQFEAYGRQLRETAVRVVPRWVERVVRQRSGGIGPDDDLESRIAAAGRRAADEIDHLLTELLALDVDAQDRSPLELLRTVARHPTEVLVELGAPPVVRDDFAVERFPDDVYDLGPVTFADVDPALHEIGISWGAAKAHVHLQRHRAGG